MEMMIAELTVKRVQDEAQAANPGRGDRVTTYAISTGRPFLL
jgi:hypothetical protein